MKKLFALVWTLFMCLSLAACGNTESDDTQSGYETVLEIQKRSSSSDWLIRNCSY